MPRRSIFRKLRYILETLLVLPIYFAFHLIPIKTASFLIGKIVRIFGRFHPSHKIAIKNLQIAFPEKNISEIKKIALNSWENLGRTAGSFVGISKLSKEEILNLAPVINKENILNASENFSKGIIIVSAHIGNWEIGTSILNAAIPNIAMIYRHANNPFVEKIIAKNRSKYANFIIRKGDKSGFRDIFNHLKKGGNLAIIADQKIRDGVIVNFFNQETKAPSTPAELAIRFNLPIVMGKTISLSKNNFASIFEKPIYPESKSAQEITQEIYNIYESWIRQHPEQWFWMHNRWYL